MKVPEYLEYKDSGVTWVGAIPSHWEVTRLKNLVELQRRPVLADDGIVTAFRDGEVTLRKNRREDGFTNALQEIGYQGVRNGDLVIHAMDGFAGAIGVSDSDGKSTPVYLVCAARPGTYNHYYGRLLRHMAVSGFVNSLAKGVRERSTEFRWSDAKEVQLPKPPLDEQCTIAVFLDRETAKIDELVEEQRRLIALLKEKRQAVISRAVTKGLNPQALLKPTGIEWLGDIPAHWEVNKLNRLIDPRRSITYGIVQAGPDLPGGVPYIRPADMSDEKGVLDEEGLLRTSREIAETYRRSMVVEGDIVCSIGPSFGKVMVVPSSLHGANLTQGTARIAVAKQTFRGFVFWVLRSAPSVHQWEAGIGGATFRALNLDPLSRTLIAVPPVSEQAAIADFLDSEAKALDGLSEQAERGINLLQERRMALISAAVTGKIDVRGLVPAEAAVAAA